MTRSSTSSKKIEKAAVLAVKECIQRCETIDESIPENDKEPLVDGCLELYSSPDQKNSNLVGKVWVQVKGKAGKLDKNKRGFCKYKIPVENLRKYQEVFHGILFFCVSVGGHESAPVGKEIYYAQLLPYDIKNILQGIKPGQKTVMVRLKPFPKDPQQITCLVMSFHADREKQLKAKISGYGFLDTTTKLPPNVSSWEFTLRTLPVESHISPQSYMEAPYIYSKDDGGQLSVIGKMREVCAIGIGKEAVVVSGDFSLKTTVFVGQSEEGRFIEFEDIRVIQSEEKARIRYTINGGFRKRYRTVALMREFCRTGEISVNGKQILVTSNICDDIGLKEELNKRYESYSHAVATLDALHIKTDWDPANMTAQELRDFNYMNYLLVEGGSYTGKEFESCMLHFDIQRAQVFAFACRAENGKGYKFYDLYTKELCFAFSSESENKDRPKNTSDLIPPVASLSKESLKKIANIDPEEIKTAFERLPITANNQTPINQFLLNMLAAYDEGCICPAEVLASAEIVARSLYAYDRQSNTYLLNLMQTVKRRRALNEDETNCLRAIVIDSKFAYEKAAACALLEDISMARCCRERCSEEERVLLDNYPISNFFKNNCR